MSNAERQRAFCARNPGYYARLKRRKRQTYGVVPNGGAPVSAVPPAAATAPAGPASAAPLSAVTHVAPTGC